LKTIQGQSDVQINVFGVDISTLSDNEQILVSNALIDQLRSGLNEVELTSTAISFVSATSSTIRYRRLEDATTSNVTNGSALPSPSPTTIQSIILAVFVGRVPEDVDFQSTVYAIFSDNPDATLNTIQAIVPEVDEVTLVLLDLDRPSSTPSVKPSTDPTQSHQPSNIESISKSVLGALGAAAGAAASASVSFLQKYCSLLVC